MKRIENGLVVAIDGIDGIGKTTQIQSLQKHYTALDFDVKVFRVLGGTDIGEALRGVILNAQLKRSPRTDLFISRAMTSELAFKLIEHRQVGGLAIVDRSSLSKWAYQVYGSGLNPSYAEPQVRDDVALMSCDATLLLDAPYAVARQRRARDPDQRKSDYFKSLGADYINKVADGYRDGATRFGAITIDATGSSESVQTLLEAQIDQLLQSKNIYI